MRLSAGRAEAWVDPGLGAGLGGLCWDGRALLSAGAGRPGGGPFAQALNLLVPFSNRISRPFDFGGATHAVPANLEGEPVAIHGDAFQSAWEVEEAGVDHARLRLTAGTGPFRYRAEVSYRLAPQSLDIALRVTNLAAMTLPYGGGFHPWLPRHPGTRLRLTATGHWPEDARHLPATTAPVPLPPDLRFDPPAALPGRWINEGLFGWDGRAEVIQPDHVLEFAAPGLTTILLYSPGPAAPFFCLEPVSHPVDAHNLPGQPGLVPLEPGGKLDFSLRLAWRDMKPGGED